MYSKTKNSLYTSVTTRRVFPWWLVLAVLGTLNPLRADLLLFADDGYMLGPVFHAADADSDSIGAARELARYLGEISGYAWPVEAEPADAEPAGIYVGQMRVAQAYGVDSTGLEPDGIRWRTANNKLFLLGGDGAATHFAVSAFLQEFCRVRWFMPGPLGEEVPRLRRLRLPEIDFVYNPHFFQRLLGAGDREWRMRNFQRRLIPFNHNLHRIFPPEMLEEEPELFPLVRGERIATAGGRGPNPNIAHPAAAEHAARWVAEYFEANPEALGVSLGTTDSLTYDESELTRQWTQPYRYFRGRPNYSDLIFNFTHTVARLLWPRPEADGGEVSGDKRYVSQLAYYWAEDVPSFDLHPQVLPVLTSDRAQWFDTDYRRNDEDLIRRWAETDVALLGTWDYYEGSPYIIPRVYLQLTADSIRFLRANRVRVFYAEGRPVWGFDVPRIWLASQLLWDPEALPGALMDEFYRRFYGPAEEPMRRFYERCEDIWMNQPLPADWIKFFYDSGQAELFPPEVCAELDAYLEQAARLAEEKAGEDEAAARFVERVRLAQDAFAVTRAFSDFYYLARALGSVEQPDAEALQNLDLLRARVRSLIGQTHRPGLLKNRTMADPSDRSRMPADNARLLLREDFNEELIVADSWGIDAGLYPGIDQHIPGSWSIRMRHTENMHLRRLPATAEQPARLRVEGASHFSLFQWIPVKPGCHYLIRVQVRGQVSPGGRLTLLTEWKDGAGAMMDLHEEDRLPVGTHDWITLARWQQAPADAASLYIGLKVNFQYGDDWAEIGPLKVWCEGAECHETDI